MTLTIQDLGALGEFFGSIAVLATLIYLALQTRQNTMAIGAQLDATRTTAGMSHNLVAAASSELQEALVEDATDPAETVSQRRRHNYWVAQFLLFQWQLIQARRGLLPMFDEAGLQVSIRAYFRRYRSFDDWWSGVKRGYRPEFVEWVEEQRSKAA